MKYITEDALRSELRTSAPECYVVPVGKMLTPAAREYLQSRKIRIVLEGKPPMPRAVTPKIPSMPEMQAASTADISAAAISTAATPTATASAAAAAAPLEPRFVDYETGAFYLEKPEHMTHLVGNVLVPKNHPRILFRGKLDSLQASVVLAQTEIAGLDGSRRLLDDLDDILKSLREIMRCDVLDEPLQQERLIGLTFASLREQSHDPQRFFGIQAMVLPVYTMGKTFALLNSLRAAVRETEAAAAEAFHEGAKYTHCDLIEALNRMSSALHVMMCRYLAGQYRNQTEGAPKR